VLDGKTLVLPDRLGNNRLDTFENLLVHREIGLLFLIPGHGNTLRISGKGQIVLDTRLQKQTSINDRHPTALLVVTAEEVFLHCAKCVTRSKIWQPEFWPVRVGVATLAQAMVTHGQLKDSLPEMQAIIDRDADERLY